MNRVVLGIAVLLAAACRNDPVSVTGNASQALSVRAGAEFSITLGTVGPGNYETPPTISSPAVEYLTVVDVAPYEPAGERQRFSFRAAARGHAILTFRHTMTQPTVEDTVVVY